MSISKKRLRDIGKIRDEDIDFSDIPELDENFWSRAEIVHPRRKKAVSIRLDEEVLDYFKSQGRGYQSRINSVLKSYMKAHTS